MECTVSMGKMMRHASCVLALVCGACTPPVPVPDAGTDAGRRFECDVTPPNDCTQMQLRYADVQPLFATHCVNCHNGMLGPWPLNSYQDVTDWQDIVRADLVMCTMPPEDAGTNMTTAEKMLILDWLRCGFPR